MKTCMFLWNHLQCKCIYIQINKIHSIVWKVKCEWLFYTCASALKSIKSVRKKYTLNKKRFNILKFEPEMTFIHAQFVQMVE